ncbi:uncharacterized protein LTHEOB_9941 [Lasiodiplodia theobromae]|uniref:uncharacterized protein n=1 Tax=Lasiodiplodia theobromae TaxID=45133 RepID=UPI0015C30286|nr:uncharacterized protein LTHEOB_9941 [Lasiodiplodia theobromae]KAF4539552.1 hypothetical protein LTHEOB_9941 [Lasiodiplodia theobromae]
MCLFTEKDFHGDYFRSTGDTRKPWVAKAKTYTKKDYWARNFSSPSELEWFISITIYFFFTLAASVKIMLTHGLTPSSLLTLAHSTTISPQSLTMGRTLPTTALAIIANTPQLLLSLAYLLSNRLVTALALSREWSAYATGPAHKPLRTTHPRGQQRSTYWLQIPYRFALPLLAASALLHYLTSQALFFAEIRVFANTGGEDGRPVVTADVAGLGSSNAAMLALAVCATGLIVVSMGLGWRTNRAGMPPVRFCSAVVAAACQRPAGEERAGEEALRWGEVVGLRGRGREEDGGVEREVGRCCFTSGEVEEPVEGRRYM